MGINWYDYKIMVYKKVTDRNISNLIIYGGDRHEKRKKLFGIHRQGYDGSLFPFSCHGHFYKRPKFGKSVKIPENLDVYFYGPADRPYAVIGIIKGTPFDPVMWEPISSDAENILKWRYLVESYNDMLRNPYWGYDLFDPNGKLFGHWLSYERRTVIKMSKDNKLQVYTPDERSRASEFGGGTN
jgi:hypothetical protein